MADASWIKFYSGDFLHGVRMANLSAEEIGVYAVILMLMAERGGTIENDRAWIGGAVKLHPRKVGVIIDKLLSLPGKLVMVDGRIGNAKMLGQVEARREKIDQARGAANTRWDRDKGGDKQGDKGGDKPPVKPEINGGINGKKSRKSAVSGNAGASGTADATRARDSELRDINTTHPIETEVGSEGENGADGSGRVEPEKGRLEDADLNDLYFAVAEASGHNPSSSVQINRAYGFVEKWRKAGVDFDTVVIPTIRAMVAESSDPTRTLGRFDARISHEHARVAAKGKSGKPYVPPASPLLTPMGESEIFVPLRQALLERLGPRTFSTYVNRVVFEDVGEQPGGRHPIKVVDPMPGGLGLMDAERASIVRACAKALGFTEVW